MSVRAIRGATQVVANTVDAICSGTAELLSEILRSNQLPVDEVISVLLTSTPDLTATFPAVGARDVGFGNTPLICAVEIDVEAALPRTIRVMLHCNTDKTPDQISHIYLHGAKVLRKDLAQ